MCLKPNKAALFESSFLWGDQFDAPRQYQTLPYYDRNNEKKWFDVQFGWGNINVEYLSHDYLHGNSFNIRQKVIDNNGFIFFIFKTFSKGQRGNKVEVTVGRKYAHLVNSESEILKKILC